jgi:membrane-bound inhibitor of C-type lysozyme
MAVLAAMLALVASAVARVPVLATGSPAGGFSLNPGSIASFTGVSFSACNSLSWGYQLDGGSNQIQATFPAGCHSGTGSNVTVGPFATSMSLRVFEVDNHCGATYYSDGTPVDHVIVSGSNPYSLRFADAGGFCERETATTNTFSGCNLCIDLAISEAPVTATGTSSSATEGGSFTATVATFTDADPAATAAEYAATIDWGDGSSGPGTITGSAAAFSVAGTHTYAEEGTRAVTVTISDTDNPLSSVTVDSTVVVADAALAASGACSATSLRSYSGPTATFVDAASPSGTASDFTATINWGDGTSTAGTVSSAGGGSYTVGGSHTFPSVGRFTLTTTIRDVGGSIGTGSCSTVGFSFAPGGGSFVISRSHDRMGGAVTFWGAAWAQDNSLVGQTGPRSFKGFASDPKAPTCAARWTADPGNSTPPPSGPLPTYMGVIVSGSVTKTGSGISGDTVHIVVVKVNPGYSSNPGHTGTGTIVAIVC